MFNTQEHTKFLTEHLEPGRKTNMFLYTLSENGINNTSDKLVTYLYKTAVEKYQYIDFDNIASSKGDITRFSGYEIVKSTLETLDSLKQRAGINTFKELDIIKETVTQLEKNKTELAKAYLQNVDMVVVLYNTMVYSVVAATSLLISTMVEYLKTPGGDLQIVIDTTTKKNKDYQLIDSLESFNNAVRKGELTKLFSSIENKHKFIGVVEIATVGAVSFLGCLVIIVPIIRSAVFSIYDIRMSTADYLQQQAEFLRLNSEVVQNSTSMSALDKKKVVKKQLETVKKLEKLAGKIEVKFEDADKKGKKEMSKRIAPSEVQDTFSIGDEGIGGLL